MSQAQPAPGRETAEIRDVVDAHLRDVPDFPKPGILFKDIGPLLAAPGAFAAVIEHWRAEFAGEVEAVAGIDARGFIFGGALAHALALGFVPVRKAGKLPGDTLERTYDLEYGSATLAIKADALRPGQRVLVLDDVLATGGTARAAAELVEQAGGVVHAIAVVMELADLGGRTALARWPVRSLTTA